MVYILYGLFFLSCLVLVASVLLQPGKTDAGALFTSNVSSSAFSPRGTATVLSKLTITAATVFMISGLLLAMPALNGNASVLSADPNSAVTTDANSNTAANANTATPDANANPAGPANTAAPADQPAANTTAPADAPPANVAAPPANKPAANAPVKAPAKAPEKAPVKK